MSLFPSARPALRVRVLPRFPVDVRGSAFISIAKANLTYTFSWSMAGIAEQPVVDSLDDRFMLVQNTTTGAYERVKLDILHSTLSTWPGMTVRYGGAMVGIRPAVNFIAGAAS
jgi:hypothetical protein